MSVEIGSPDAILSGAVGGNSGGSDPLPDGTEALTRGHWAELDPGDPLCDLGDFTLNDTFFAAPTQDKQTQTIASELPDGFYWQAKWITFTVIYSMVFATAGAYILLKNMIETMAREFNLYTSVLLLGSVWEKSVGLPDTRLGETPQDLCSRKQQVKQRLTKKPTITMVEYQLLVDDAWKDLGIWLSTGSSSSSFRYNFRYFLGEGFGTGDVFVIEVHIPWLAIDPDNPGNDPITLENLLSWFRDFVPAYIEILPIFESQASYAVITDPQFNQTVYAISDDAGGYDDITIYWKQIDIDGNVTNHVDTEDVNPFTTEITRSFTDSTTTVISDTNDVSVITLL